MGAAARRAIIVLACSNWLSLPSGDARAQPSEPDASPPAPEQPVAPSTPEDDVGFGDAAGESAQPTSPPPATAAALEDTQAPSEWILTGSVRVQTALRSERSGADRLAKFRPMFAPRLEYKHDFAGSGVSLHAIASGRAEADFAYLLRRDAYDAPTLDVYGALLVPGETYVALHAAGLDLALGEQIVTFGQGEILSALDVVNPRDLREPLLTDLDQLRLPVLMTRLGLSFEPLRFELLAVHEPYFGLLPPPLGEFSPFRKLLLDDPALGPALKGRELSNRHIPGRSPGRLENIQFHGRLSWHGPRVDLALQAASLLDGTGVARLPDPEALTRDDIAFPVYHPRYGLLGHSGALSAGPVVLRWELAADLKRPLTLRRTDRALPLWSSQRLNIVRGLIGLTYAPSTQTTFSLEVLQAYVLDNPGRQEAAGVEPLFPIEATQVATRLNHQFLHERAFVSVAAVLIGIAPFNAWAARLELGYALFEAVKLALGLVTYQPSAEFGVFYGFERNDRIFCNLRWDFAVD